MDAREMQVEAPAGPAHREDIAPESPLHEVLLSERPAPEDADERARGEERCVEDASLSGRVEADAESATNLRLVVGACILLGYPHIVAILDVHHCLCRKKKEHPRAKNPPVGHVQQLRVQGHVEQPRRPREHLLFFAPL
jgi:hypothetical protein